MPFSILIIAAGSSSRLGQPKQLLPFRGKNLLSNTIDACRESKIGNIHLVLGANYESILNKTDTSSCHVHINPNWQDGMGKSIAFGIKQVKENIDGVIVSMADQPFLEKGHLKQLVQKQALGIVLSKYEEGNGPPTFFSKDYFEELSNLSGDDGAKAIIKKHKSLIRFVPFPKGNIDIDRKEDLKFLKQPPTY